MKKLICLVLALILLCSAAASLAEQKEIDGKSKRNIKIHEAGLNPTAEEMISQGISPTTGRNLDELSLTVPAGYLGTAMTGEYLPIMVQVSNSSNGFNTAENIASNGDAYKTSPVNGEYADIVYEVCQASNGTLTRMTMIYSDVLPDFVGYIRSTRYTHVRLRQEWGAIFLTSGYADYVLDEWTKYNVPNPMGANRGTDPGPVYVGGVGDNKPWRKYYSALDGISDSNNKLYNLIGPGDQESLDKGYYGLVLDEKALPKDKFQFPNHTWLFTDDIPEGGDDAEIIYVRFGHKYQTDSRLEYDPETKTYTRWVTVDGLNKDYPYSSTKLLNPKVYTTSEGPRTKSDRAPGPAITFSNVIVQAIDMDWQGSEIPDPKLVGSGNADYFMGGKHYAGVWQRKDINSRTVYYDQNGEEIKLQRGRTLIILMNYSSVNSDKFTVKYE